MGLFRTVLLLLVCRSSAPAATALLPSVHHHPGNVGSRSSKLPSPVPRRAGRFEKWERMTEPSSSVGIGVGGGRDEESRPGALALDDRATRRRSSLAGLSAAMTLLSSQSQSANAIDNPLNLKGTFWETGKLYEKSNEPPPDDDGDFLAILENTVEALRSPELTESIAEGKYGKTSRLLRGGLVSESKIRIAANALIDSLPEDDEAIYESNESFRVFLRYLDVLDAEVEAASRPLIGGEGDPRMRILTRLGEVEESLKAFLKNVRGGMGG